MATVLRTVTFIALNIFMLSTSSHAMAKVQTDPYHEDDVMPPEDVMSLIQVRTSRFSRSEVPVLAQQFADQCDAFLPMLNTRSDDELRLLCTEAFSTTQCDSAMSLLSHRPWSDKDVSNACTQLRVGGSLKSALLERSSQKMSAQSQAHHAAVLQFASGLEASVKRKGWPKQLEVPQPPYWIDHYKCNQLSLWLNHTNETDETGYVSYYLNYSNVSLFLNASYAEQMFALEPAANVDDIPYEVQAVGQGLNETKDKALRKSVIEDNTVVTTDGNVTTKRVELGTKFYVTNCSAKQPGESPSLYPPAAPLAAASKNGSIKNKDWEDVVGFMANSSSMNVTDAEMELTENITAAAKEEREIAAKAQPRFIASPGPDENSTVPTVTLLSCEQEQQTEQCFGLKKDKKATTWQACQANCCKDMECEVWQFNRRPMACYRGVPKRCGATDGIWDYWDYGGRKSVVKATVMAKSDVE